MMIKYFLESNPTLYLIWDKVGNTVVYQQQIVKLSPSLSLVYQDGEEVVKVDSEIAVNWRTSVPPRVAEILYNRGEDPVKNELFSALIHGINTRNGKRYSHD